MSTAVFVIVPVSSTKPIASVPMLSEVGGGHSWLVGKSPSTGVETGVQARPSFGPPLHLRVVALQIGHGWMNVRQLPPPGQSASVMHPKLGFEPPMHWPGSHAPRPPLQSAAEQQGLSAGSEKPLVQRPVSLTHVPPEQVFEGAVLQVPPAAPQPAPGVEPPTQRFGSRSPTRKIVEPSGRLKFVIAPVEQSLVPEPLAVTVLMTHVLVGGVLPFGSGSGGPKRQPAFEHWRKLHVPPGQLAFVVHELLWFEPPEHRLPPAWAGVVPLIVSDVPAHDTLETVVPMSGTANGSGTPTAEPPT